MAQPLSPPTGAAAVILAAGRSARMGRPKPLLPLGRETVLARAVGVFQRAGLQSVLVVLGHRAQDLVATVEALGARPVLNPDFQQGMFSSLTAGVAALPTGVRAFFVLPVDIPLVRVQTVRRLLAAWQQSGASVLHPTFQGLRGHPPLLDARLGPKLAAWSGPQGLRGFLAQQAEAALEVPVADRFMLCDLDTEDEYCRLLEELPHYYLPSPAECLALLREVHGLGPELETHCRVVARLALALGRALADRGLACDLRLIAAGGLLHDLGKGQPGHAAAGARLLGAMGFERVARVVAAHVDLEVAPQEPLGEAELVFLADKLVKGDRLISLEQRFAEGLARHGADPRVRRDIQRRWDNARRLQARVEAVLGQSLPEFISAADLERQDGDYDLPAAPR